MRPQGLYVTPHARQRFRERIDPDASDAQIDALFMALAQQLPNHVTFRREDMEALVYRGTWRGVVFTAWVGHGTGEWPAVATVIEGDDQLRRWEGWTGGRWRGYKHGRQLRTLQKHGCDPRECSEIMRRPLTEVIAHWLDSMTNPAYDSAVTTLGEGRPYYRGNSSAVHMAESAEEFDSCG